MFWLMLQVDPIQSYLNLKIGLPPVIKAGYIYFHLNYYRPCVRINCYNNADWPNANKDEINNAIKKCLEVFF